MPVWDVPAGDEMGPRPGAQGLNRTRHKATGRLEIYARPHNLSNSTSSFIFPSVCSYLQHIRTGRTTYWYAFNRS